MNTRLMEILRCPGCGGGLNLKIYNAGQDGVEAGLLSCGCGERFAIYRGVPRMLLSEKHGVIPGFLQEFKNYLQIDAPEFFSRTNRWSASDFSFSAQWENYEYSDETWEIKVAERVPFFYRYLKTQPGSLSQALVLDAGCGNGTLSAALAASGPEIVAMDFSTSVERAHRHRAIFAKNRMNRIHYVQADIQQPPFGRETFDAIYSDGVLHHTPDTRTSFNALAPLVKSGGRFFVWLYRKDLSLYFRLKASVILIIRSVLRRFPRSIRLAFCYVVAAIMLAVLRLLLLFGYKSQRKIIPLSLKATNLMDTFTPQFKHEHTPDEVKPWFETQGFTEIEDTTIYEFRLGDFGFGMLGVKK
ncbi:MAG: methyltransferase domain-containing protein [bacterium]